MTRSRTTGLVTARDSTSRRKWYNRAKFSIIDSGSPVSSDQFRHKEETLAVWEYLERTIDLATIERVFARGR